MDNFLFLLAFFFFLCHTFTPNPNKYFPSQTFFSQELPNIVTLWGKVAALLLPFPSLFYRHPLPSPWSSRQVQAQQRPSTEGLCWDAVLLQGRAEATAEPGGDAPLPPRCAKTLPGTLTLSTAAEDPEGTSVIHNHIGRSPPTPPSRLPRTPRWGLCSREAALRSGTSWIPESPSQTDRLGCNFLSSAMDGYKCQFWHLPRSPLRQGHQQTFARAYVLYWISHGSSSAT